MPLKQSQVRILEKGSAEPEGSTFPRDDFVAAVAAAAVGNAAGRRQAAPAVPIGDASTVLLVSGYAIIEPPSSASYDVGCRYCWRRKLWYCTVGRSATTVK
jgi:hypothetical protein